MESSYRKVRIKFLRRPYVIAHRLQFQAKQIKETRAKNSSNAQGPQQQKKMCRLKSLPCKSPIFKAAQNHQQSSCNSLVWLVVCYYMWQDGNFADCKRQVLQLAAASRLHHGACRPNLIKKQPQQRT